MQYHVPCTLSLPEAANPRYAELSPPEANRGYRIICGNWGDLYFGGYVVEDGETILIDPVLSTSLEDLTEDEVAKLATEILMERYAELGIEAVELG